MAFSPDLKTRLTLALAEPAAATELETAIEDAVGFVSQVITNGVTTLAPSEDAVYDALALKLTASQAANVAAEATADATDLATVIALANAMKVTLNAEIAALKAASVQASS